MNFTVDVLPHPGLFTATPLLVDPPAPELLVPPAEEVVPPAEEVPPLGTGFVPPVRLDSLLPDTPPEPPQPVAELPTWIEPPALDVEVASLPPARDEPPVPVLLLLEEERASEPPAPPLPELLALLAPPPPEEVALDPPVLVVFPPDEAPPLAELPDEVAALPPAPEPLALSEQLAASKARGKSQCDSRGARRLRGD